MRSATVQILLVARDLAGRAINGVKAKFAELSASAKSSFSGVQGAITALGVSLGSGALVQFLVSANTQFQQLQARLQTFTGDAGSARAVFDQLSTFAATTPFELQDVVEAFITLRSAGITPTEETLTRLGDQASAFGGNIAEMAEAVRAASTGEMERLKRFGIVARIEGERVALTFNGVTTRVNRDAQSITNYLETLSASKFGGAMAREMNTLGGQISNLKDNLFQLATQAGESGLSGAFMSALRATNAWLEGLRRSPETIRFVVNLTMGAARAIASTLWNTVTIAFRTGQAIGTAFRLTWLGVKSGALEAAAFLTGTFNGVVELLNKLPGVHIEVRAPDFAERLGELRSEIALTQTEGRQYLAGIGDDLVDVGTAWIDLGKTAVGAADETARAAATVQEAAAGLAATGLATGTAGGGTGTTPELKDRIALLAEGVKHMATAVAADAALARLETELTAALAAGNLTLERRVELAAQLDAIRKSRKTAEDTLGLGDGLKPEVKARPLELRDVAPAQVALPADQGPTASGVLTAFEAMTEGARGANEELREMVGALEYLGGTALAALSESWTQAWAAYGEGSRNAGEAIIKAGRQAIGKVVGAKAQETALDAARAAAEGLTNPAKLLQAAKLFAISAGYSALSGMLGGGGGGGRGGRGGLSGGGREFSDFSGKKLGRRGEEEPSATIVIEGGFLNMNDPRQAEAFEAAVNRLNRQGRLRIVGG